MIKAGQLKATIARALHLPEKRVDYPYRVALDHGEISKGKRGRGGASVTESDGAKALIAVASSYIGGEVIQGIQDFSCLQLDHTVHNNSARESAGATKNYAPDAWMKTENGRWALIELKVPHLQSLRPGHTFSEALTALIEAARNRAFGASHKIAVIFYGPEPKVGIEIEMNASPDRCYVEKAVYLLPNRPEGIEAAGSASGLEVTVKIDQQTIYAIAALFRYDGGDEQGYPGEKQRWDNEGSHDDQLKHRTETKECIGHRKARLIGEQ